MEVCAVRRAHQTLQETHRYKYTRHYRKNTGTNIPDTTGNTQVQIYQTLQKTHRYQTLQETHRYKYTRHYRKHTGTNIPDTIGNNQVQGSIIHYKYKGEHNVYFLMQTAYVKKCGIRSLSVFFLDVNTEI